MYIGKRVYYCLQNSIKFETTHIREAEIHGKDVTIRLNEFYRDKITFSKTEIAHVKHDTGWYSGDKRHRFYLKKSDAIRYCKAQMFKRLKSLENSAKISITSLKKFKEDNWDLLQNDYTERNIMEIERSYNF